MNKNTRYVITGYDETGSSRYWRHNVGKDQAQTEMDKAIALGWTHMQATPESF